MNSIRWKICFLVNTRGRRKHKAGNSEAMNSVDAMNFKTYKRSQLGTKVFSGYRKQQQRGKRQSSNNLGSFDFL